MGLGGGGAGLCTTGGIGELEPGLRKGLFWQCREVESATAYTKTTAAIVLIMGVLKQVCPEKKFDSFFQDPQILCRKENERPGCIFSSSLHLYDLS